MIIMLLIAALMQPQLINVIPVSFNLTIGSGTPMYGLVINPNSSYVTYVNGPGLLYVIANASLTIVAQGVKHESNGSALLFIKQGESRISFINENNYSVYVFYMFQHNSSGGVFYSYNPIGVADYGVALYYDEPLLAYSYETSEVVGVASIRSLSAVDVKSGCGVKAGDGYVDIQLNSIVKAGYGYYIVQDVVVFNGTAASVVDNVWNMTSPNATLSNLVGLGSISRFNGEQYYAYNKDIGELKPPFNLTLAIMVNGDDSAHLSFGYGTQGSLKWFDNVTIINAGKPSIIVNGSSYVKYGVPIDTELVITGPVCGIGAVVKSINATFTLLHKVNESYYPAPYTWGIGTLTGEAVANASSSVGKGIDIEITSNAYEYPGPLYHYVPVIIMTINGSGSMMVPNGYVLNLTLSGLFANSSSIIKPIGFIINETQVIRSSNISVIINGPTEVSTMYSQLFKVTLIGLRGNEAPLVYWYPKGYVLRLKEPRYMGLMMLRGYLLNNNTLVKYPEVTLVINGSLTIKVLWSNEVSMGALMVMYIVLPLLSLLVTMILFTLTLSDANWS
ncbi:MAG: thermopsin family protease [Caldivirga sp.]|uniref:thermopsin family protease n=1 Tax=Caldivirga sp. TaxID=2080243 RepID=UPI003D12E346